MDVVIFGRCAWDEWRIEESCSEADYFGGSAANIAVTLAQLGLQVRLIADIGRDALSMKYLNRLVSLGIDISDVRQTDRDLAVCSIIPGVSYSWKDDYKGLPEITPSRTSQALRDARAAIFTDVTPPVGIGHMPYRYWIPQLWLNGCDSELSTELGREWTAVFANRREVGQLMHFANREMRVLSTSYPKTRFVCTREAGDTHVYSGGIRFEFATKKTRVKVAIGGGDALAAGYVYGDMLGMSLDARMKLGHELAGSVVGQVGCQLEPDLTVGLARGVIGGEA